MTNVGYFYTLPTTVPPVVPDALVSVGVVTPPDPFPKRNRSYFQWLYGKPPDVVVEVVFNDEGGEDTDKLDIDPGAGVSYYVVHGPELILSRELVRVFRRDGGRLVPSNRWTFPDLNLGVTIWDGPYEWHRDRWLRRTDGAGEHLIPTGVETADAERSRADAAEVQAVAERKRVAVERRRVTGERKKVEAAERAAEAERTRAEAERTRAEAAEREAETLREMIRKLGGTPPTTP